MAYGYRIRASNRSTSNKPNTWSVRIEVWCNEDYKLHRRLVSAVDRLDAEQMCLEQAEATLDKLDKKNGLEV